MPLTKTANDEVLEFLRSYIAGGVNQDFKPWARELYAKLYSARSKPPRDGVGEGELVDGWAWIKGEWHDTRRTGSRERAKAL